MLASRTWTSQCESPNGSVSQPLRSSTQLSGNCRSRWWGCVLRLDQCSSGGACSLALAASTPAAAPIARLRATGMSPRGTWRHSSNFDSEPTEGFEPPARCLQSTSASASRVPLLGDERRRQSYRVWIRCVQVRYGMANGPGTGVVLHKRSDPHSAGYPPTCPSRPSRLSSGRDRSGKPRQSGA
jgi:hypothetical protein